MTTKVLITTGEAAEILGVSGQHVRNLCDRGELSVVRVGVHRRVHRNEVEEYISRSQRLTPNQERSLRLGHAIAGELAKDPHRVIGLASRNLERMQRTHTRGQAASYLRTWERILKGPVDGVLHALTSRTSQFVELRVNTPFAGVLDETTRRAVTRATRVSEVDPTMAGRL